VPETLEPSLQLAAAVLSQVKFVCFAQSCSLGIFVGSWFLMIFHWLYLHTKSIISSICGARLEVVFGVYKEQPISVH
jgi:hypothetical protein